MNSAVIYARYSSDRQTEQSIEGQLSVCNDYAKRNDIVITGMYIDRALTGRSDDRPEFQRMIEDSKSHGFDIVLVYKFDRFSRDRYDSLYYERELKKNGVKIISATEAISDDPQGILLKSIIDGYSEYYSAELAQKVKRGNAESRKKGLFTGGRCIFGYKIINQRYVIDEFEASIVRRVFNEFISGKRMKDIRDVLNKESIITSTGTFKPNRIPRMLKETKYIGKCIIAGSEYLNMCPPIIDVETFEKAQTLLESNKKLNAKEKADIPYYLTGKLYCGNCGSLMVAGSGTSHTGKVHLYYKCIKKTRNTKQCDMKTYKKEQLEKYVFDSIIEKLNDENIFNNIAYTTAKVTNLEAQDTSKTKTLEKEIKSIDKKLDNFTNAIANGIYNENTQKAMLALIEQKEKIQTELAILDLKKQNTTTPEKVMEYLEQFKKLDYNDPTNIKMLFNLFLKRVIIKDNGDIVIICNNGNSSKNKKNELLDNKKFEYDSNGEPYAIVCEHLYVCKEYFYIKNRLTLSQ